MGRQSYGSCKFRPEDVAGTQLELRLTVMTVKSRQKNLKSADRVALTVIESKGKSRKSEQILERRNLKTAAGVHSSGNCCGVKLALP